MDIKDGKGRGFTAEVNSDQQLEVRATIMSRAEWENHNNAEAYCMYFSQAAANGAANEVLAYIQNTSDKDMVIDEFTFNITAANTIYISKVTGTPGGGPTTIVPTNMNVGSGKTATGNFYKDDSMSGLTDVGRLINIYLAANGWQPRKPDTTILLKKNSAIAIFVTTQQAQTLNGTIFFHYEAAHAGA